MALAALSSLASPLSSTSGANKDVTGFAKNFDSFLLLLTQQLKNQDPLSPMDATQFTTQLVQFTAVEQQIKQNQSLESLVTLQYNAMATDAANYIGKTVDVGGRNVVLTGGEGTIGYNLATPAKDVTIAIRNSSGEVVRTITGDASTGMHSVTWDGRSDGGQRLPDGSYAFTVTARDSRGTALPVKTGYSAAIDAVDFVDGAIMLRSGNLRIALADVTSVRAGSLSSTASTLQGLLDGLI